MSVKPDANEKSNESFIWFMTKIAGIAAGIGLAIILIDPDSNLASIGKQVLKYAGYTWGLFAGIPIALKMVWTHREKMLVKSRDLLSNNIRSKPISNGLPNASGYEPIPNVERKASSVPAARITDNALPAPFDLLPRNPRPMASEPMTPEAAGELIKNIVELSGLRMEESPEVLAIESGPSLQNIVFRLPPKLQLSDLVKKRDDLANHLGHPSFSVVASKYPSSAGFIIPHQERAFVYMRDVADQLIEFAKTAQLPILLGSDMEGEAQFVDLTKLPHLLVAGSTGSGKSVFINGVLSSLMGTRSPEEVKFLLVDPKMVELTIYNGFPHLLAPVVTEPKRAAMSLKKVVVEMEKRYELFSKKNARNIMQYNKSNPDNPIPYIVTVIDEYADLMMVAGSEVEDAVTRITQMGRAAGIHLIMGTQRPSVDVVTGVIKSNLPSRIAFRLPSPVDYRVVMDASCPHLLGGGDGVCMLNGGGQKRFQSAAISADDAESTLFTENLKKYWERKTGFKESDYHMNATHEHVKNNKLEPLVEDEDSSLEPSTSEFLWSEVEDEEQQQCIEQGDEYERAVKLAREHGGVSGILLQKNLRIDYIRAAKYVDRMAKEGLVGEYGASGMRPLLKRELTEADQLDRVRKYICQTRSTKSSDLREVLGIRKETVLQLMGKLVEEGFLNSPENARSGYTLAWDDERIDQYLGALSTESDEND
ncbi:FtsK/SpoIIIE domain-containing protein [Paenibacillus woosongensis]|uniref:FtsK domain-containing protein n=1 Tax=Paenibacillus woosongensis TaxID=307580 RepID=A0ABQ4MYZ1_9BACL|nr:FtsK/SpoIIIE domain-containing protein [Paenibacillus woosongensis]GIP61136.1 hypothetical protein J15TS10_49500 [Paenibacillus woosongensis]